MVAGTLTIKALDSLNVIFSDNNEEKVTDKETNAHALTLIDMAGEDEKDFTKRLLISSERKKELMGFVCNINAVNDGDVFEMLRDISKHCKHPNELALACFVSGGYFELERSRNESKKALKFLKDKLNGLDESQL